MLTSEAPFGSALKWWRTNRRFSQLQLAADADVSSRHLSFLETGKAKPSREMVIHLATVLDLPLRDRNGLLHTAGFAPLYPHTEFQSPEMEAVREVVSKILEAHMPNPAIVIDRCGEILQANPAAFALLAATVSPSSPAMGPSLNIHRLSMHPDGTRARTTNWHALATNLLDRLDRELIHRPADQALDEIVQEVSSYPGVEELPRGSLLPSGSDLLLPFEVETFENEHLSFLTTISTIGTPYDVTLDELRLETLFPADDLTQAALNNWASPDH